MLSAGAASSVKDLAEGEDWSRQSKLGAHPDGLTDVAAGSSESHIRVMSQDIHTGHPHERAHALSQNDNVERRLEAPRRAAPALPSCSCCSATAAAGHARTENFLWVFRAPHRKPRLARQWLEASCLARLFAASLVRRECRALAVDLGDDRAARREVCIRTFDRPAAYGLWLSLPFP